MVEFEVPIDQVAILINGNLPTQEAVGSALKATLTQKSSLPDVPVQITGACSTFDLDDNGQCPRGHFPSYHFPPPGRRLEGGVGIHYDYEIKGLDEASAAEVESGTETLATNEESSAIFSEELEKSPTMHMMGLSMTPNSLKSKSFGTFTTPLENDFYPDYGCYQHNFFAACYDKLPDSVGKSCSNAEAIYLTESPPQSLITGEGFNMCARSCTEHLATVGTENGCKGFEIQTTTGDFQHCILYTGRCTLGEENKAIQGQYYLSDSQPSVIMHTVFVVFQLCCPICCCYACYRCCCGGKQVTKIVHVHHHKEGAESKSGEPAKKQAAKRGIQKQDAALEEELTGLTAESADEDFEA
jgi:hypothetical protein